MGCSPSSHILHIFLSADKVMVSMPILLGCMEVMLVKELVGKAMVMMMMILSEIRRQKKQDDSSYTFSRPFLDAR